MRLALALCAALVAQAQEVGHLLYRTGAGRGVSLVVVDGGHKAFITLQPVQGQADQVRGFVLTHTGPERLVAPGGIPLAERAPQGWRVREKGDRRLLRTAEATYWCYTPGLVLPVRFRVGRDEWALLSADLPPRMLVSPQ